MLLPYEWYETPNIHLLTIKDFQKYCASNNFPVKKENHFSVSTVGGSIITRMLPNLRAQYGFFVLNGDRYIAPGPA